MINSYLVQQIKGNFLYKPTLEQEKAVKFLADFLFSRQSDSVFLLKGYAGTGKTSLIGALVKTLDQLQQKCVLLARREGRLKSFHIMHSIRLILSIRRFTASATFQMTWTTFLWMITCISILCLLWMRRR